MVIVMYIQWSLLYRGSDIQKINRYRQNPYSNQLYFMQLLQIFKAVKLHTTHFVQFSQTYKMDSFVVHFFSLVYFLKGQILINKVKFYKMKTKIIFTSWMHYVLYRIHSQNRLIDNGPRSIRTQNTMHYKTKQKKLANYLKINLDSVR